jgi:hypothetical protein
VSFWDYLYYSLKYGPGYIHHYYYYSKILDPDIFGVCIGKIFDFYNIITLNKLDTPELKIIITGQVWLLEYIITVFCAWKFVVLTCPWLSSKTDKEKISKDFIPAIPYDKPDESEVSVCVEDDVNSIQVAPCTELKPN